MPKVAVAYTGCKLNRYEIQVISESLEGGGFEIVPFKEKADCYLINTCSVTNGADVSSRQLIRRARRTAPDSKVVVTGCYAQLRPDEIEKIGANGYPGDSGFQFPYYIDQFIAFVSPPHRFQNSIVARLN